jgi:thiamine biosynthesis lipoprotein
MRSHSGIETRLHRYAKHCGQVRRCRPLLGTLVEIACQGSPHDIDCAFTAVEKVQRLMSFHDPSSDVARINRHAWRRPVKVHPWTHHVVKLAQEFSRKSDGVFDVTVARQLVKWNYLPRTDTRLCSGGSWRDILLDDQCKIRFRRRMIIDLGGIAKGFAVDRAVEALKKNGVAAGIVNAGGDLRIWGSPSQVVHLRHPAEPTRVAGTVRLRQRALATSGIYFERRTYRGNSVAQILNGRTGQAARELISVSVAAAECMVADALTKIVYVLREKAADLLTQSRADALLLERNGTPSWSFHSPCDTRDQTRFD